MKQKIFNQLTITFGETEKFMKAKGPMESLTGWRPCTVSMTVHLVRLKQLTFVYPLFKQVSYMKGNWATNCYGLIFTSNLTSSEILFFCTVNVEFKKSTNKGHKKFIAIYKPRISPELVASTVT